VVQVKALDCPNCGASIADTSKACSHCGSRIVLSDDRQKFVLAGTICQKCGTDNNKENRFCNNCGDKLFKICPNCKTEIGLDSLHCAHCGANFVEATRQKELAPQKIAKLADEALGFRRQIDELDTTINKLNIEIGSAPNLDAAILNVFVTPIAAIIFGIFVAWVKNSTFYGIVYGIFTIFPGFLFFYMCCGIYVGIKRGTYETKMERINNKKKPLLEKRNFLYGEIQRKETEIQSIKWKYNVI